ncbi:hypothetical protein MTP99_018494 [Tenebrio molitor]|nr:hypothetical protein MTP99_018494 [Tenebrio molitor]CAH1377080.1 unnamed protein product [Tenebrio molitor]
MSLDNICYITVLVAVLGLISPALGIRCFQCNSFVNPECADIPVNDTHSPFLHKCEQRDDYQMFCRKVVQTVLDAPQFTRITRTCGWYLNKDNRTNCQVSDTDFKMETTCQCFTEACNTATVQTPAGLSPIFCLTLTLICLSRQWLS